MLKAQAEQLKIQFGSAIAEEASGNQYISIPGLKGLPARNLSTKTLSNIIQARMEEILEYVVYHLKQHDLDKKLHGGIILTGGGSSLKHLKQLTEFKTGLNTRIGYPTEHLSGGYDEVLNNPMYSTCIGLILKGYLDLEKSNSTTHVIRQKNTELSAQPEAPVAPVPQDPVARQAASNIVSEEAFEAEDDLLQEPKEAKENPGIKVSQRVASIFGTLKNSIKELFSENEDQQLN
ncbi:Cell division protein FtsA [compost metagenome]